MNLSLPLGSWNIEAEQRPSFARVYDLINQLTKEMEKDHTMTSNLVYEVGRNNFDDYHNSPIISNSGYIHSDV